MSTNETKAVPDPAENGRCAVLSIDNLILRAVQCNEPAEFDYTNRFICERTEEQHHEVCCLGLLALLIFF